MCFITPDEISNHMKKLDKNVKISKTGILIEKNKQFLIFYDINDNEVDRIEFSVK